MQEAKIISKEEPEKEEVKKVVERYSLGEVVTGTAPVIAFEGKVITEQEALVELLNKLDRLEKNLIG